MAKVKADVDRSSGMTRHHRHNILCFPGQPPVALATWRRPRSREPVMSHAARYLVAELATLVDELRNPRTPLSRSQLADLADRAWRDASSLTTDLEPTARASAPRVLPEGGAQIIPLFR